MKRSVKWFVGMCFWGMISFPGLAMAEFYKYIDENGKVRFTDNLANIPPEQRKEVEEYQEAPVASPRPVQDPVPDNEAKVGSQDETAKKPTDGRADQAPASEEPGPGSQDETAKQPTDGQLDQTSVSKEATQREQASRELEQRLLTEGEQLQQEYDALMEERAQLDNAASKRLTPAAHRELEKKVQDYNARIKDYDERRKAHNQSVEDYKLSGQ